VLEPYLFVRSRQYHSNIIAPSEKPMGRLQKDSLSIRYSVCYHHCCNVMAHALWHVMKMRAPPVCVCHRALLLLC
jgi:hypothetical protein